MEKEIYEILNRNDYVRLTAKLKSRVEELAKRIREKMEDLDIANNDDFYRGEIGIDNVVVRVKSIKSRAGEYEFLSIKREGECYGESSWYSLEDIGKEYYYAREFSAKAGGASRKRRILCNNSDEYCINGGRRDSAIEKERKKRKQSAKNS